MTEQTQRESLPARPYKRWDYFAYGDSLIFFGRAVETGMLFSEILSSRLVLLYAKSGTGKTSLINAGVSPLLERERFRTFVIRMGFDPFEAIQNATESLDTNRFEEARKGSLAYYFRRMLEGHKEPVVLFLDQFEEFFINLKDDIQAKFVEQIAEVYHNPKIPVFLVFSLREDFFVEMDRFRKSIPNIFHNNSNLRLRWFQDKAAEEAIVEHVKNYGVSYQTDLVEQLLDDLRRDSKGIEPIRLQLVCDALWDAMETGKRREITLADYEGLGGVEAIEKIAFEDALRKAAEVDRNSLLPRLLRALITDAGTKNYRELNALSGDLKVERPALENVLTPLQNARLIRVSRKENEIFYELSHDYLVPQVQKWLGEKKSGAGLAAHTAAKLVETWEHERQPIGEGVFELIDEEKALVELDATGIEMLAQAAVFYGLNISYWLRRLPTEQQALILIQELLRKKQDESVQKNCVEALASLRSVDATSLLVQLAVADSSTVREKAVKALLERDHQTAARELHDIMGRADGPPVLQKNATSSLALMRRLGGVRPPADRAKVYAVMAWEPGAALGPSEMLGQTLAQFEDSLDQSFLMQFAVSSALLGVALLLSLYRGLVGAVAGIFLGSFGGILYAIYRTIAKLLGESDAASGSTWRFLGEAILSNMWQGLKFGVSLGYIVGILVIFVAVFVTARKAMKILKDIPGDYRQRIPGR